MAHHDEATPGPDVLIGGSAHERIEGDSGDDVIDGGGHSDILQGQLGQDIVLGGSGEDMVRGGDGRDYVRGGSGDDFVNGGAGRDFLHGGAGDDHLLGDAGDDRLWGGDGDDTLRAETGDDILIGGRGDDTLIGGQDADTFVYFGDVGDDVVYHFQLQNDVIDLRLLPQAIAFSDLSIFDMDDGSGAKIAHPALQGSIQLRGIAASDLTAANFALPDGSTTSLTFDGTRIDATGEVVDGPFRLGDEGGNRIFGGGGGDHVLAGEGNDRIEGKEGADALFGEEGRDIVAGGAGSDWLFGGEGDDKLDGGTENDRLYGGEGSDQLTGGAGNDLFVFGTEMGVDTVTDFTQGADRIDLSRFAGISSLDDLRTETYGATTVIDLNCHGGGMIRVEGIGEEDFDAGDFVFHEPQAEPAVDGM